MKPNSSKDTIALPAEPLQAPEKKSIDAHAKELGTPDWLVAALKHHFRARTEGVTAEEYSSEADRIANHPIGGGR